MLTCPCGEEDSRYSTTEGIETRPCPGCGALLDWKVCPGCKGGGIEAHDKEPYAPCLNCDGEGGWFVGADPCGKH